VNVHGEFLGGRNGRIGPHNISGLPRRKRAQTLALLLFEYGAKGRPDENKSEDDKDRPKYPHPPPVIFRLQPSDLPITEVIREE
jgi:hypothetical protein